MASETKMMTVYTIVEKPGREKPFWVKVGACFTNRDGSLNVFLDALPANGKLHIRQRDADDASVDRGANPNREERSS